MSNSFVSIDVETANSFRGSICQVGLVRVEDGRVVEQWESFIKPPPGHDYFDEFNVMLHGITEEDVADAPELPEFKKFLIDFAGELPLVAHNAAFDIGALRDGLDIYEEAYPNFEYFCTLVLSRRSLDLISYALPNVAEEFGIRVENHHKADVDALICAEIALGLVEKANEVSLLSLAESFRVSPGRLSEASWQGCHFKGLGSERFSPERLAELKAAIGEENYNPDSPMLGQNIVFTGTLGSMTREAAWVRVSAAGAIPEKGVTKKTNILVFGVQDSSHLRPGADNSQKFLKAQELKAKGQQIEVVDEVTFLRMLYSD